MSKIMKPLKVLVDLQTLLDKKVLSQQSDLLKHKSYKLALGGVTLFSEVFDLYLYYTYSNINMEEVKRWLYAADIFNCFRNVVGPDENIRDFCLQNSINVTINSDRETLKSVSDVTQAYWLLPAHVKDDNIQEQIRKVTTWNELIRDITKYATVEDYEFNAIKK